MKNKPEYTPISCSFHDILLAKASLKQKCQIIYHSDGVTKEVCSVIIDVFTKAGEEFLVLDSGDTIRLDCLVNVDGEEIKNWC